MRREIVYQAWRRSAAALRARAAELGEDATPLDYGVAYVANGGSIKNLANELGVSRPFLSGILNGLAEDASDRLRVARESGAHALVEQGLDIADDATPETVNVARLRVATRQWVAERWNARELAAKPANVAVQINVGALMLEALRQPISSLVLAPAESTDQRGAE